MQVSLTIVVPEEMADPGHSTGLTESGYEHLMQALADLGCEVAIGPTRKD